MSEENQPLAIVPAVSQDKITLTPAGEKLISDTIDKAVMIGRVSNQTENQNAVEALLAIKATKKKMEDSRVAFTKPLLDGQRAIKAFYDEKVVELNSEERRLLKLSGDWVQLEEKKRRAEENARREELTRLEREREKAVSECKTHAEVEAVQAHYNDRAAVEAVPPPAPVVAKSQSAKPDWEIEITDCHLFARCYPSCVTITEKVSEIKALLRAGTKMDERQGIRVKAITNVGVRLPPTKKPIDV